PDSVWMMDMRAGAISEADRMGASREQLSQAAQHADIATTGRYVRNRSDAAAKVIELRQRNRL
ncbi:MAG: recombinase, partial [Rhodobacteraceae bacterium]|nr:recombinase [Paracoccaceae bacterium]